MCVFPMYQKSITVVISTARRATFKHTISISNPFVTVKFKSLNNSIYMKKKCLLSSVYYDSDHRSDRSLRDRHSRHQNEDRLTWACIDCEEQCTMWYVEEVKCFEFKGMWRIRCHWISLRDLTRFVFRRFDVTLTSSSVTKLCALCRSVPSAVLRRSRWNCICTGTARVRRVDSIIRSIY